MRQQRSNLQSGCGRIYISSEQKSLLLPQAVLNSSTSKPTVKKLSLKAVFIEQCLKEAFTNTLEKQYVKEDLGLLLLCGSCQLRIAEHATVQLHSAFS